MFQLTPPSGETVLMPQVVELTGAVVPAPLVDLALPHAETGSCVVSSRKAESDRLSRVESLVEIFERAKKLLRLQSVGADADSLRTTHEEVRSSYNDFVRRWGRINAVENHELFERTSPIGAFLRSLEIPAKGAQTRGWEPGALLTDARGVVRAAESRTHAATPEEALLLSLAETGGRVLLRRVGELLGVNPDEAFGRLGDLVFRDPGSKCVVTRDEYLSGDIRQKLDVCITAVADGGTEYERNVRVLEEVLPPAITRDGMFLRLGATWVPQDVVRDFARHLVGSGYTGEVVYNHVLGRWRVDAAEKEVRTSRDATQTWGTERLHVIALLDDLLNLRTPEVRDNKGTPEVPVYVTNPVETAAAQAKAEEVRAEFERWAWADDERAARLLAIYNERFNRRRARRFSGAHLALAGMNREVVPYEHQRDGAWRIMQRASTALVYKVGYGKAQPDDAKVLTPTGWREMGSLRVGDQVIAGDGTPTRVTGVFPQGEKEIYKVVFSDGSGTECCDEHLWKTETYRERENRRQSKNPKRASGQVRSLADIRSTLITRNRIPNHRIPMVGVVEFSHHPVDIDPYLLGILIGDGCMSQRSLSLTTADREVLDACTAALPAGMTIKQKKGSQIDHWIVVERSGERNPVPGALRAAGLQGKLSHEKFVPNAYKYNAPEIRLAILQGLMDADGTVASHGMQVSFSSTSRRLAEDIRFLVMSLGGTASIREKRSTFTHKEEKKEGRLSYVVEISVPPGINPFRLSRKADLVRPRSKYPPRRDIVAVEVAGRKQARCIAVEHPDRLYVTDDFIVTHNTLTGIITAMELRRAGLARKPVAAVPREAFGTWVDQAITAYPGIRLCAVSERDFRLDKREETLARLATQDWDLVVMTHEQFERIDVSDRTAEFFIHEHRARADAEIKRLEADKSADYRRDIGSLRRHTERIERDLRSKREERARARHKCGVTWDDIGCDLLLVDEFQAFKGLDVPCRLSGVAGLASTTSERASDMRVKLDQVRRAGGRIAALTGTPITNSLTEAFVLQCFLQPEALEAAGLTRLDAWLANFGEITPATELAPEGTGFRQRTRLRRFQNLPGLSAMLAEVMDVRTDEDVELADVPRRAGGSTINVAVEASDELKRIMRVIAAAAGRIRKGTNRAAATTSNPTPIETIPGAPALDNMLALMGVGRRAAVDPRLVDEALTALAANKLQAVADRILAYYRRTTANLGTQLVFLDQGTPKLHSQHDWSQVLCRRPGDDHLPGLSDGLYPELMAMLVRGGIPAHEVRFIHDVRTLAERRRLEDDVNAGRVRVLIGSTGRMGKAMNAQRRVVAIHHVDPPLRPSDIEQRDGRGLRPGNLYPEVFVLQYVSKGSFDGFVFQLLENKGRVARQILRGTITELVTEDVGDCVLTASQAKAIASGDPRVRERIEAEIHLSRLARLRDAFDAEHSRRHEAAEYLPRRIAYVDQEVARLDGALAALDEALSEEEREVARLSAESKEHRAAGGEAYTLAERTPVDLTQDTGDGSAEAQPGAAGQAHEENAGKKKYFRMELAATTATQPPGAAPLPLAVYNDRAEAGREIARLAVELSTDAAQSRCGRTAWVGRYRGFLVALTANPTRASAPGSIEERHGWSARMEDSLFGRACEILLVPEREARAAGTACECERLYANITATHAGTIASIDAELRGLRARVARRQADRMRLEEELAHARSRLGAGWTHAERYTLLRERLVTLTQELAAEGNDFGEDESTEAVSAKYPSLADGRYWANGTVPGAKEVRLLVERMDREGEASRTSDIHDYDRELAAGDNLLTGLEIEPIRVDERTREYMPADLPEPNLEDANEVSAGSTQAVTTSPSEVTATAEANREATADGGIWATGVMAVEAVEDDAQSCEQKDGESSTDRWFRDLDRLRLTGVIGKRRRRAAASASAGQMCLF